MNRCRIEDACNRVAGEFNRRISWERTMRIAGQADAFGARRWRNRTVFALTAVLSVWMIVWVLS